RDLRHRRGRHRDRQSRDHQADAHLGPPVPGCVLDAAGTRAPYFLSTPFDAPAAIPVESSHSVSKGMKKVLEPAERADKGAARTKGRRSVPFTTISGRPIEPP